MISQELIQECIEMYERLKPLGERSLPVGWFRGWIHIEPIDADVIEVMWTTDKDSHFRGNGARATIVEFCSEGLNGGWFESAISMWPIRDEREQSRITELTLRRIERALRKAKL